MNDQLRTRSRGRVLLGHTGESDDWRELQSYLSDIGRNVVLFDATMRADRNGFQTELPQRLEEFELAVLIVSKPAGRVDGVSVRCLVHLAGLLQGRLGFSRVLVLVDRDVDPFLHGTGVPELAYENGDIRSRFPQVIDLLHPDGAAPSPSSAPVRHSPVSTGARVTPWLERFGVEGSTVAPEIWVVLGVLVVLAALAGVIGYQVFSDPVLDTDDQASVIEGEVDEDGDESLAAPGTSQPGGLGSQPLGGPDASVQLGVDDGRADGLPAVCTITTASGQVVPQEIVCDGIGGLRTEGFLGPWHNDISEVTMGPGVIGEVFVEPRPEAASATRVQLQPGVARQPLEGYDSLFGVQQLRFEFGANGQEVVLHQRSDRGGNELRLVFSLDL